MQIQPLRPLLPASLLAVIVLLGACTPQQDSAPPPPMPSASSTETAPPADATVAADDEAPRTCNADPVQALIGQEASEAVVAQATADSGSASVRVLKPGQPATMDFRQDRLNILTDDAGVIERLSCG